MLARAALSMVLALLVSPAFAQDADQILCARPSPAIPQGQQAAACDRLVADTGQRASRRATAHVLRARLRRMNQDRQGALADYGAAIALDADNTDALVGRAMLLEEMHDYDAALADLNQAQARNPDIDMVYLVRSVAHMWLHHPDEAIADADHDFRSNATGFLSQRCLARAVAGRELEKARAACDQALWITPGQPTFLGNRGLVGLKQRRFQAAWDDYDTAFKRNPGNAWALYGRGLATIGLGREAEGKTDLAAAERMRGDVVALYATYGMAP